MGHQSLMKEGKIAFSLLKLSSFIWPSGVWFFLVIYLDMGLVIHLSWKSWWENHTSYLGHEIKEEVKMEYGMLLSAIVLFFQ